MFSIHPVREINLVLAFLKAEFHVLLYFVMVKNVKTSLDFRKHENQQSIILKENAYLNLLTTPITSILTYIRRVTFVVKYLSPN